MTTESHNHDHHHHHHHSSELLDNMNRMFAIAVVLNLLFCLVEAGFAIYAHSMSLLADAGHNLGDVFGLMLAWGANWFLGRSATDRYSYGYKRTTMLASLINALILVAGCAIIAYESVIRLLYPGAIQENIVIYIALIGIAVNGGTALLFMRRQAEDLNIKAAWLHLAADALVSVGVVVAATIVLFTHWYWLDPIVGLLIISVILISTWGLLKHSLDLLLDAVPPHIDYHGVARYLLQIEGVSDLHDLHIWGLSTRETALTAHLIMPEHGLSDSQYAHINEHLRHTFRIHHVTLQVEKGGECSQQASC